MSECRHVRVHVHLAVDQFDTERNRVASGLPVPAGQERYRDAWAGWVLLRYCGECCAKGAKWVAKVQKSSPESFYASALGGTLADVFLFSWTTGGRMSVLIPSQRTLRYDRDAELLLIAEVSRWLETTSRSGDQESMESVMALLERQQHVAACRALDRPIEA
jgi:hypothetical protein